MLEILVLISKYVDLYLKVNEPYIVWEKQRTKRLEEMVGLQHEIETKVDDYIDSRIRNYMDKESRRG